MSRSTVLAGHHKRQTDLALHAAFRCLAAEPKVCPEQGRRALPYLEANGLVQARACFESLLDAVRARGRGLLDPAAVVAARSSDAHAHVHAHAHANAHVHARAHAHTNDGAPSGGADPRHPGVTALLNLARWHAQHLRAIEDWPGCAGSWRVAAASLAAHLLARWPVPMFLAAAWYADDGDDAWAEAKRRWYVAHAAGASFRSLDGLPFTITRAMERILLATKPHVDIMAALRRAELRSLGASPSLIDAVLASRHARDLRHGDFWRGVWMFFIAHDVRCDEVAPMIDFIDAVRHGAGHEGAAPPPMPAFSIEGRTPASMRRLMSQWHRSLAAGDLGIAWPPSGLRPFELHVPSQDPALPPVVWTLHELTNSAQLRAEGSKLRHCVAGYVQSCVRGSSRIWSLGRQRGATFRPVLTIEVDPETRRIVQARGLRNAWPRGRPLEILRTWAARERLTMQLG